MSQDIQNAANDVADFLYGTEGNRTWLGNLLEGASTWVNDPLGTTAATTKANDEAAQNTYTLQAGLNNTAKIDSLKLQQEKDSIATLQTQQADALSQYKAKQDTAETAQTEGEQANYTSAFGSIASAEERIGSEKATYASGASQLVSNAALRGIKVSKGEVQNAGKTGQGSELTATQGTNGTGAGAGTAAVTAVGGADATPGAAAVTGVDGASDLAAVAADPAIAAIAGSAGTAVTAATAATPMNLSVTNYSRNTSPLAQLAAYELNADQAIRNEETQVAVSGNAELKGIADQAANYETNAAQNLLGFETTQNNNLAAAQTQLVNDQNLSALGQNISANNAAAQESFTSSNLATYDSSLWVSAWSQIVSYETEAMSGMKVQTYQAPADPDVAASSSSSYYNWGSYYG